MANRIGYNEFLQDMHDIPGHVAYRVALVVGAAERLMELYPASQVVDSPERYEAWAELKDAVTMLMYEKEEGTDSKDVWEGEKMRK